MNCTMYTTKEGPDGMLLERNGNFDNLEVKMIRFVMTLVEILPPLSIMNVRLR